MAVKTTQMLREHTARGARVVEYTNTRISNKPYTPRGFPELPA